MRPLADGRDTQVRIGRMRIEAVSPITARRLADTLSQALEHRLTAPGRLAPRPASLADRAADQIVAAIERATEARS